MSNTPADSTHAAGMDVSDLRKSAADRELNRDDLNDNPFLQFQDWFETACALDILDPNAMAMTSVDDNGMPYTRTVLLKSFDERGFVFYSNYESRKARQMETNPQVSLLFFWRDLGRQIGIRGSAEKLSAVESLKYFASRPRGSQLGAWVSPQSSIISSRSLLKNKFEELKQKFADGEVPLPSFWGGYRIVPSEVEFWQGRDDRLHDRFLYSLDGNQWRLDRLAP